MAAAIPRLGNTERIAAWHYVSTGAWSEDYRAMLKVNGIARPPAHVFNEIRVMQRRRAAGDEDWADGTSRPRSRA